MAADIKNYLKEKEKRQKNQDDYKKKIRKHKEIPINVSPFLIV
jgi:hypothetical protein